MITCAVCNQEFEEDIKLNWKTIKVEYCFDVLDKDFITIYEKNKVLYEKIFDQNDIHFTFTEFEEYYQARYRIDKSNSEDIPSEGEIKNLILNIIEKIKQETIFVITNYRTCYGYL